MINSKVLVSIGLTALIIISWMTFAFADRTKDQRSFEQSIKTAEDYFDRGLYQLSIKEYKNALKYKKEKGIYDDMFKAYDERLKEDDSIYDDYVSAVDKACNALEGNVEFTIKLANLYLEKEDYESAYNVLDNAEKSNLSNDDLDLLYKKVKYSYVISDETYSDVSPYISGNYAVKDKGLIGAIDANGTETIKAEYKYLSPAGEDGIRLYDNSKDIRLIDSNNVVQGIIRDKNVIFSGIYSEDRISIFSDGVYGYCNKLGDFMFGGFDYASMFVNGRAAVQKDNKWYFINKKGKQTGKKEFKDIRINNDGSYIQDNIIIADDGNGYRFYDENLKTKNDFKCDNIDVYTKDNLIAFSKDGDWGFTDSDGNVKIKPQYEMAKSFSNGLAAVCKDGKWGFINNNNELVTDYIFADIDYLNSEGSCMVNLTNFSEDDFSSWQLLKFRVFKDSF